MKECLVKEVSRDVMYLELFIIQLQMNVNKLHVSQPKESSVIHNARCISPFNIIAVITVTSEIFLYELPLLLPCSFTLKGIFIAARGDFDWRISSR